MVQDVIKTTAGATARGIGATAIIIIGFPIVVLLYLFWAVTGRMSISEVFKFFEKPAVDLSDKENAHLICGAEPVAALEKQDRKEAVALLDELLEERDWESVAALVEEWDQSFRATPGNIRLSYLVFPTVAKHFAKTWIPGNTCHPEDVPVFDPEVVDSIATLVEETPDDYVLAAIYAYFLYCEAWYVRGTGWINEVKPEMVARASENMLKAQRLLDRHEPVARRSILLASVRFGLITIMEDGDRFMQKYYEEWATIDPEGQRAQTHYARLLQPRWYGTPQIFEEEARRAATEADPEVGMSRYATFYREAIEADYLVFLEVDLELLEQGLMDLAKTYQRSPEMVAQLYQEFKALTYYANPYEGIGSIVIRKQWRDIRNGISEICDRFLRAHLTAICPSAWEGGRKGALWAISFVMEDELKQGMRIEIGEAGLRAVAHESDQDA